MLDPNFKNLKSTLQRTIHDIRKTNHATLKKSPFEFRKTELSLVGDNVEHSHSSAQGLEKNLLIHDYSRDRAKVEPYPLGVGGRIEDSQP